MVRIGLESGRSLRHDEEMISIAETPYCRLYIDTEEAREAVQSQLDRSASTDVVGLTVYANVFKNDAYEGIRAKREAYNPTKRSIWTAEIDAEETDLESFEKFQSGLIEMIRGLRGRGMRVTASCNFEERIACETGWNWSFETPEPPH